jgi:superfamily II DNA or RNA helicase
MLQLRPHQAEVVEKLSEGFKNGHRCQMLYAPTGFGKTEVAMAIMKKVADNFQKTAIVLDRVVLVEQTSLRLGKYDIPHGVMQSTHWRHRPYEAIQVCSAQTLEKRKIIPDIDLMIIDEAHVQRRGTTELIKNNPNLKVIGLSATPFTNGLGSIYSHVVGASSTGDLIEKGWLTPLKVFIAKEINMVGAKKDSFGEWAQGEAADRGMQITGDIVAEWVKMTMQIYGKPMKTIVFCAGVKHGKDLEAKFKEAGYNFVSISYKEDDEFKRQTIEDFSRPDTEIHGLIATDILTRGFDVSDVCIGVSARPFSKSFSSHVQQLGRVMRPHEGKEFALWLDHSGNYLRFRKDWDDLYDFGVKELKEGKEVTRKEPTEREKKDSKCPSCGGLWTSSTNVCDECGFIKINPKEIITVAGEMRELDERNRQIIIDSQKFYGEVLFYAKQKGYKEGWAAYKYKEKFNAFPPRSWGSSQAIPTSPETLNWIKSRLIAYSKARQK